MFLSIIIPVYNLEEYIEDCIESCLNQSFEDYEIICVNDGSKDNSAAILDAYSQKHPKKIKVIHKPNGGVSSARNKGLEMATGKWLWFVDGDDYIAKNCIPVFAKNVLDDDDFVLLDLDKGKKIDLPELTDSALKSVKIDYNNVFTTNPTNSYAGGASVHWFKKEIIKQNNICFDEQMRYSEDVKFIFQYKLVAKNGGRLFDNIVYFYREHAGSAMHSVDYEQQIKCMKILTELYHNAMLNNPQQKEVFLRRRIDAVEVIQFNLLYKIRDYKRTLAQLEEWEKAGIYPYKVPKIRKDKRKKAKRKIKVIIIDFIKLTFTNKRLYLLLCKLFQDKNT